MRYLVLLAGMGRRMGSQYARAPKCLIDVAGEPLIARLMRQIRTADAGADVHAVLGFASEAIMQWVDGCRIIMNPFFDITGINASLWFARASFDRPLMVIHGDVVLSDALAADLFGADAPSLVAYDSSVLDPGEINVAVTEGRVTRLGVNFEGYAGAYGGIVKLSSHAARLFAETLDRRVQRGFNEPRTYYFFVMRRLIADPDIRFAPFDFAGRGHWEIDRPEDVVAVRQAFRAAHVADVR
ncbi:MAG: NTP transferase domain-containing protein [Casimicrobiaceae bacterium]